ncbi:peptidylprolyl isomerase [Clostridium haemolyticum]|uniref:peptidylprolyl isomerase n=1 Tax=Clostridium haemolyticum NCTC 9693 TaxID=1443114 RepID=A0ABR4TDQ8_CLOHA|nr:peptidylprolyl isomerase [Clostridium haemolyticum]KEI15407.1 peptidylprolyl isomerase [Clostridium haemolyticum NCTC 9693]KGN04742.1 peptidylprolyl isomerase [Clostridium haemolyticum NCTC 8350]
MKNIRKLVATAVLCIFTMSVVGCSMIEKTPEAIKKTVVAKVGDRKITKGELDSCISGVLEQFKQQYGDNFQQNSQVKEQLKAIRTNFARQIGMNEVYKQEALKLKAIKNEEELNKELNNKIAELKKQNNIKDDAQFEKFAKSQGFGIDGIKQWLLQQVLGKKIGDELTKNIKVDDKEVEKYYNENKDKYPKDQKNPTKIHVAHIILKTATPEDDAKAKDEIKSIKEELNKGADFAVLAKKYSQDGSKDNGGDLGTVPAINSKFDQDFMDAALTLKDGEISNPVKTQFGYHIIKMIKREEAPCKTFDEVKSQVKEDILQNKKNEVIKNKFKEIQDKANVKIYEDKIV